MPQVLHEVWAVATRPAEHNSLGLSVTEASVLLRELMASLRLLDEPPELATHWQRLIVDQDVKGKTPTMCESSQRWSFMTSAPS